MLAALDQQLHRRGLAARHRPLEHRGLHGVDDGEDELLHRRMRRPAYFSPSRRRLPSSSHAEAADQEEGERREEDRDAGAGQRRAFGVDGQGAGGLGVEPAAHAREQVARGQEAERSRQAAPSTTPGAIECPWSASEPAASIAPSATHRPASAYTSDRDSSRPAAGDQETSPAEPSAAASRNGQDSRNAKSVPSKSSPRFALASAPASRTGSIGRTPIGRGDPDSLQKIEDEIHAETARRALRCQGRMTIDETPRGQGPGGETTGMPTPRSGARDLERYAGLFARRTQVMKSSAMRDLMAVTARPEVISLAGGLPDTSTFPAEV